MNDIERKAAEVQLDVLKLQHLWLESQLKGDLPGHPFRGNQWEGGGSPGGEGSPQTGGKRAIAAATSAARANKLSEQAETSGKQQDHALAARAHSETALLYRRAKNEPAAEHHFERARNHLAESWNRRETLPVPEWPASIQAQFERAREQVQSLQSQMKKP